MTQEEIKRMAEGMYPIYPSDEDDDRREQLVRRWAFADGAKFAAGEMFTKEDLIDFARHADRCERRIGFGYLDAFKTWLKERERK